MSDTSESDSAMSEHLQSDDALVIALEKAIEWERKRNIRLRRWFAAAGFSLIIAVVSMSILITFLVNTINEVHDLATNTNKTVKILDEATGPAAQQKQQQQTENAVREIGCEQRKAIQESFDTLVQQGILHSSAKIAC